MVGRGKGKRILELERETSRGLASRKIDGGRDERERDLDELVAGACVLRSDTAIKQIDKAFITAADDRNEWVT
jgi:hypothetical protein